MNRMWCFNCNCVGSVATVKAKLGSQSLEVGKNVFHIMFHYGFAMISALQGLYISLLETRHALLVILDTEGLLSVEARDDVFDKQVALMTMACSDLVIVNNRGELGRKLGRIGDTDSSDRIVLKEVSVIVASFGCISMSFHLVDVGPRHVGDLFQVCLFALYHLKLARISPAIGFVLQCLSMVNQQQQYEWVATVKRSLEDSVQELQQKETKHSFKLQDRHTDRQTF